MLRTVTAHPRFQLRQQTRQQFAVSGFVFDEKFPFAGGGALQFDVGTQHESDGKKCGKFTAGDETFAGIRVVAQGFKGGGGLRVFAQHCQGVGQ